MGTACYKVNKIKNGKRWNKKLFTKFGFNVIFLSSDTADDILLHNTVVATMTFTGINPQYLPQMLL